MSKNNNAVNILFTSGGRRVQLITAFKNAYESLGISGKIIVTDINPLTPAFHVADKHYIVPYLDDSKYIPTILRICKQEKIHYVFPLIDPDIPILAKHRKELETTGVRVMAIPHESVVLTNDKWETYKFFTSINVLTPQSWIPEGIDSEENLPYPLFIKPRDGSASRYTYKINKPSELRFFCDYVPSPIIQEFLPGPEITNDVVCDADGNLLAVVSRQRIQVRGGEVAKGKTVYDERIINTCANIAEALPAIGPITVQCMMKNGAPYFTEINARLGGGVPLAIKAGVDFPKWLIAQVCDLPVEIPPIGEYQTPLYLTRFDNAYYLDQDDYDNFESHNI